MAVSDQGGYRSDHGISLFFGSTTLGKVALVTMAKADSTLRTSWGFPRSVPLIFGSRKRSGALRRPNVTSTAWKMHDDVLRNVFKVVLLISQGKHDAMPLLFHGKRGWAM
jgi:hypothetical protein